jgi:DNA-binding NarL/FixJ family response regulator
MLQHVTDHSEVERLCSAKIKDPEVNVAQRDIVMLLVGKPGHLRDALQSLISVVPGVDKLVTADTGHLTLQVMREVRPALVLVENGLPDLEGSELVRQIKEEWPETGCLVLTDITQHSRQSLAAGADCVLPAGSSGGQLFSAIQHMLESSA